MDQRTIDIIKEMDRKSGKQIIDDLSNMLSEMKNASNEILQKQSEKISEYLNQLAENKITPEQLHLYLENIKIILNAELEKIKLTAKNEIQKKIYQAINLIVKFLSVVVARLIDKI